MIIQTGISGNAEGRFYGKVTEQRKASGKEAGSNSVTSPSKKLLRAKAQKNRANRGHSLKPNPP